MPDPFETESVTPEPSTPRSYEILTAGKVVANRYVIHRQLGVGGSSVVYAALDRQLGRDIALKVLRTDRLTDKSLARFRREVNLARELRNPHLISVYDLGQLDDSAWITMELVDGETLRSTLAKGPLPVERVVDIGKQVLDALKALHDKGIVHRDVKPGNIMLTPDGEVKLADLGLARHWEGDESRATSTDGLVGTFEYLSPEQALGLDLDARSDLYSFGVLLYELLTGQIPFKGGSSIGTVVAHLRDKVVDVRAKRRDTPAWLAIVIMRLLEKKREERYQNTGEVFRDFQSRKANWRFALRKARVKLALGVLIILAIAGGSFGWRAWSASRFDHFALRGAGYLTALDRKGDVLWERPSDRADPARFAAICRFDRWGPVRIAALLSDRGRVDQSQTRTLSILDAQTGQVEQTISLPDASNFFPGFSDIFMASGIAAVDLDHDGRSEIVASFGHVLYWPSYTILYDPRSADARIVSAASGHQFFEGAADIDQDGNDDLILFGPENRMGWYSGVAAVAVRGSVDGSAVVDLPPASTPDAEYPNTSQRSLLWYALVSSEVDQPSRLRIDTAHRRIVIPSASGPDIVLGFDGFIVGSHSSLVPTARRKARVDAYRNLRQGTRLLDARRFGDALEAMETAEKLARDAGDALLAEWTERNVIRALIGLHRTGDAEARIDALMKAASAPGNVAWDAAREYFLTGNPERAAHWYERGLYMNEGNTRGRHRYEYVEGAVLALGQLDRWNEARKIVSDYRTAYVDSGARYAKDYLAYIEWRSTGHVPEIPQVAFRNTPDLYRYWSLEFAALGKVDQGLLSRIDQEIARSSGNHVLLRSLRADVLERLGRHDKAVAEIRNAYRDALVARDHDPAVRAEMDVVEKRFKRITGR